MDNRHWKHGCPALMSDGRFGTNYMDNDVFNQIVRNTNKIGNSHDYRTFLQKNGNLIMDRERGNFAKKYGCKTEGKCVPLS